VFEVRSYDQMAEMARSGRLQASSWPARPSSCCARATISWPIFTSRAVADLPLHLLVNRRYADRIPALDQAIQTLRGRGEIDRELRAEDR